MDDLTIQALTGSMTTYTEKINFKICLSFLKKSIFATKL